MVLMLMLMTTTMRTMEIQIVLLLVFMIATQAQASKKQSFAVCLHPKSDYYLKKSPAHANREQIIFPPFCFCPPDFPAAFAAFLGRCNCYRSVRHIYISRPINSMLAFRGVLGRASCYTLRILKVVTLKVVRCQPDNGRASASCQAFWMIAVPKNHNATRRIDLAWFQG